MIFFFDYPNEIDYIIKSLYIYTHLHTQYQNYFYKLIELKKKLMEKSDQEIKKLNQKQISYIIFYIEKNEKLNHDNLLNILHEKISFDMKQKLFKKNLLLRVLKVYKNTGRTIFFSNFERNLAFEIEKNEITFNEFIFLKKNLKKKSRKFERFLKQIFNDGNLNNIEKYLKDYKIKEEKFWDKIEKKRESYKYSSKLKQLQKLK